MSTHQTPTTDPPELLQLPAPAPDALIEQTAAELRAAWREGALQTALRMGEILVTNLYAGDLAAWRARGAKDTSFRRLAERLSHDDSPLSAAFLYRACALYELEQRVGVSALKHLTASHAFAVLGLPDTDQRTLLERAEREGWTTRQLEDAARRRRPSDGRGRKPLPVFQKGLRKVLRAIQEAASEPVPEDLFVAYGRYGPADARAILGELDAELERLGALRAQVEARIREAEGG